MKYARLGRSGMSVSRIALGTATFGVAPQEEEAIKLVHAALDLGVTYFDCANTYGDQARFNRPGAPPHDQRRSAEEILGTALAGKRLPPSKNHSNYQPRSFSCFCCRFEAV